MSLKIFLYLVFLPAASVDASEDYGHRIDRVSVIADAISDTARGDTLLAAFLAVQAYAESRLSREAQNCQCRRYSCDHGRAHGPWNLHRVWGQGAEEWHSYCGETYAAVRAGAERQRHYYDPRDLEGSFAHCGGARARRGDSWVLHRAAEARRLAGRL